MERDSTEDWMLPDDRPSAAERALLALEDGISEVGRIALTALEQSGRAAELAELAAERAEQAAASRAEPPPSTAVAAGEDRLRDFAERADRVARRLRALERRPGMVQVTAPDPQEQWP